MTPSSSTNAQQKAFRKRLAALARKTNNRICCDCPEKAPTWAAILPPHDHAPLGSRDLVAFICFSCAGAHRQLGSLVSQVKSIALDDWDEYDVESAERSGNKRVNQIYEGTLKEQASKTGIMVKPLAGAHEASRLRFVREKYGERTYYSKSIHFKHVAKDQQKHMNAPLTPSTSKSSSSRRTSLNIFLKPKDSGGDGDRVAAVAFGGKEQQSSVTEGTYDSTRSSGIEQQASQTGSTVANSPRTNFSKRRHSEGSHPAGMKTGNTFFGPPLSTFEGSRNSFGSKSSPKSSRENSQRSGPRATDPVPKSPTKASRKKDNNNNFTMPPDSTDAWYHSEGSMDINDVDSEEFAAPAIQNVDMDAAPIIVPLTPRSSSTKPKMVSAAAMASPTNNSRVSLYSKANRGRSSSRNKREKTSEGEQRPRERSSSRVEKDGTIRKSRRGRSTGTNRRQSDPEKPSKTSSKATTTKTERRSTSRTKKSRPSSSPSSKPKSSNRTASPNDRIKKDRTSASPLRTPRERSSSRRKDEDGGEKTKRRSSRRSMSTSSPSRKQSEDALTKERTSKSGRGRSRSGSRIKPRGKSLDSMEPQKLALREHASKRTARERSRSRAKAGDVLNELNRATSRRNMRDGHASFTSESTNSIRPLTFEKDSPEKKKKTVSDNDDGGGGDGDGDGTISNNTTNVSPSNKFDGNMSLSIDSVFSNGSSTKSPSNAKRKSTSDILKEGEESFQVISTAAGRSYSFGVASRKVASQTTAKGAGSDEIMPSHKIFHGGKDKYENLKRRQSRTKVAAMQNERSSRRKDILSALKREGDEGIGPLMRMSSTPRSRDDIPKGKNGGGGGPLRMHGSQPTRTRSEAGTTRQKAAFAAPLESNSWHERDNGSTNKPDDDFGDCWIETKDSDERRADFEKSFSIPEFA